MLTREEIERLIPRLRGAVTKSGGIDLRDPDLLFGAADALQQLLGDEEGAMTPEEHIQKLRAALEPFARMAALIDGNQASAPTGDACPLGANFDRLASSQDVTVGDLRRAREALSVTAPKPNVPLSEIAPFPPKSSEGEHFTGADLTETKSEVPLSEALKEIGALVDPAEVERVNAAIAAEERATCFECGAPLIVMGPVCPACNPGLAATSPDKATR